MSALKDIGNLSSISGVSSLSQSPIWHQSVDKIDQVQIHAFIRRMTDLGRRDEAETTVEIMMKEIMGAVARGEISPPKMLQYKRSAEVRLTLGEFRRGLTYADQPYAAAILFALEVAISPDEVSMLTWTRLQSMEQFNSISDLAKECTKACARSISTPYVFWKEQDGKAVGLFDLNAMIFEAFGMMWSELEEGYANIIMIDEEADKKSIGCFFQR